MPYRQNFPIPGVIDPPKTCLQIEIPNDPGWKAVISGLLFELSYWFNWERTGDTSGAQCAAVWKKVYNSIDWGDMSCCCEEKALITRVNPDTGNIEQSSDGGATWQQQPGGIRSLIVQPVPPVTSGVAATKCDAATNVAGQVDVWIDQVSNDFTTAVTLLEFGIAVIAAIAGAVLVVITGGGLLPLEVQLLAALGAALYAAWGAGKAVFDAYWTTEIKDKILCDAYCNIGDDGSFTEAQFSAFWNDVNGDLPPGPAKMLFMGFLSSVGMPGLNAMAASGMAADADCGDCECFDDCANEFEVLENTPNYFGNVIERGDGYLIVASDVINTNGRYYHWIWSGNPDQCCYITSIEVVSGAWDLGVAWGECGSALGSLTVGILGERCVNQLQPQSTVPFTLKYNFTDCP